MPRICALAAAIALTTASPTSAFDTLTIIYLDPASPRTSMFMIKEWPSYLFLPNAPISSPFQQVSGTRNLFRVGGSGDLDCADISARNFRVSGADPNRYDGDRDGIGCEY